MSTDQVKKIEDLSNSELRLRISALHDLCFFGTAIIGSRKEQFMQRQWCRLKHKLFDNLDGR